VKPFRVETLAFLAAALFLLIGQESVSLAQDLPFTVTEVAQFDQPWAMAFLPDGRLLVSETRGKLKLFAADGDIVDVAGVPEVRPGGQGGLGDIVLHPDFADNDKIYLSYAEGGAERSRGAAVAVGRLQLQSDQPVLDALEVIWRQVPKISGNGHFGYRLAFGPDGYLWISSGERKQFDPAQDMDSNLGKIVRLHDDGSVPTDNPFADRGGVASQVWSLGHRNPLGIAFDHAGGLWNVEMGPLGGDELNLILRGENYGYPIVSEGSHYDGSSIPDHNTRPDFQAPAISWTPVISPSSLIFYDGSEFPEWQGNAFIGGLSSETIVRVEIDGEFATEAQRFDMGERIRAVAQGPDGALWVLEDGRRSGGRLLRLTAPD
jgi:glucose/arabinose dehydrogenase